MESLLGDSISVIIYIYDYIYIYIVNRSVISVFYIRYGYLVVLSIQGAVRYVVSTRSNMVLFDAEGVELRANKKTAVGDM